MISNRAREAMEKVDHYPFGDVREWARRNWAEAVCPYMDEFIAALKNKSAVVSEDYFDETSPVFLFTDVKAMHGLADGMRGKTAREKSEIMSEVFYPLGQKWMELLAAVQKRVGACAEARAFKTKLALVADSVKLMFAEEGLEAHADTVWNLRREMIEAFGALRDRVCAVAPTDLPRTRRPRHVMSNKEMADEIGVSVKTIIRWKDETNMSDWARAFRGVIDDPHGIRRLGEMHRAHGQGRSAKPPSRSCVRYDDGIRYDRIRADREDSPTDRK